MAAISWGALAKSPESSVHFCLVRPGRKANINTARLTQLFSFFLKSLKIFGKGSVTLHPIYDCTFLDLKVYL